MSNQLINLNPELKQLRDEGYDIEIHGGWLIIHHVPYVNVRKEVKIGKLACPLDLGGNKVQKPSTHVMSFSGEYPCHKDGQMITAIEHTSLNQSLKDFVLKYSFSNKPGSGYNDFYHKVTTYINIISSPAKALDKSVTAMPFNAIREDENSVFQYVETNSSRCNISHITSKLENQKVGIIGLGGTGSYILDFIAKTSVAEIRIIDGDIFSQHNAFRAPGAPSFEELDKQLMKVDYFGSIYSKMHKGIKSFPVYLNADNLKELLDELDFVFIALDKPSAKQYIFNYLLKRSIPFIDVGIGANVNEGQITASLRTTSSFPEKNDHIFNRISLVEDDNNEYVTNIQIAELNAMNAILAVIRWKKYMGYYFCDDPEYNSTFNVDSNKIYNDEFHHLQVC